MQVFLRRSPILLIAVLIAACAAHRDPIVDMKGVDPDALAQDWQECEAYTQEIAVSEGVARGSATGAAVGAVAGAINGDVARAAANGSTAVRNRGSMPTRTSARCLNAACAAVVTAS